MTDDAQKKLQNHLDKTHSMFGLILPDGWFGRPYDNMLSVTELHQKNDVVSVVLDDWLAIEFKGGVEVCVEEKDRRKHVAVRGFDQLTLEYVPHGSNKKVVKAFDSGDLVFVEMSLR